MNEVEDAHEGVVVQHFECVTPHEVISDLQIALLMRVMVNTVHHKIDTEPLSSSPIPPGGPTASTEQVQSVDAPHSRIVSRGIGTISTVLPRIL